MNRPSCPTSPDRPAGTPAIPRVLHLLGATGDHGGIVSVLRGLQVATQGRLQNVAWVNDGFRLERSPALDLRRSPHALDESDSHLRLLVRALKAWPGLRRLLAAEAFDVVHAHTRGSFPLACALAALRDAPPVVFTNHTYARRTGMYRRAGRWPRLTTTLLTPNMARHYGLEAGPDVRIISECGADAFFARPLPIAPRAPGPMRIVGIGNLVRWKRWDLVLHAIAMLPPEIRGALRLEVWGPTPDDADAKAYAGELTALVLSLGLAEIARFRGPTRQVADVVAAADWFVLPSTHEPCSVALIEALALGVPVIASASGGNVDIVADGVTGCLFRPGDAGDLAAKLTAVRSGQIRPAAPEALRASVGRRSATHVGAEYLALYRELLAAHGRAR